jgi:hypothetical protein
MIRNLLISAVLPAYIAFQLAGLPSPVSGEEPVGVVGGVTRDSASGRPVPEAHVVAHNLEKGTNRAAVSGTDGAFAIANLEPGHYEVAATKDGFRKFSANVEVAALGNARLDVLLAEADAEAGANTAAAVGSTPLLALARELEDMKKRIEPLEAMKRRIEQLEAQLKISQEERSAEAASRTMAANQIPITPGAANPNAALPTAPTSPQDRAQNQAPAAPAVDMQTPFADFDWTWLNGNSRQHDFPLDSKYFSGEFRADTFYGLDFNQPKDHSMGGSSEVFRSGEVQVEDLSIGGDFHAGNMRGRVLALFGMFSTTTPRNDASAGVGQWDVRSAYKYISEAYGGYHFNVQHGINVDAGIFVSYIGLFSYHNFDNWAYQPSYVSSNTPWFFNGVRVQWFPTHHLKIEPWFINGWQAYNKFNGHPGIGGQIRWTPKPWLNIIGNQYAVGNDNIGLPHRGRYHTDDSIEVKYYDKPERYLDKMAFSFTGDMGCETGQGVTCHGGKGGPKQSFLGYMIYNRFWFKKDLWAMTLGGGQINNPGRYLALVLPVNGADAISGTPYFPSYPGATFKAWDATATFDAMPNQFTTFRMELGYRHVNVPYWSGRGGITPPGGNNGFPAQFVCNDGTPSLDGTSCGGVGLWKPDLRRGQLLLNFAVMVKL